MTESRLGVSPFNCRTAPALAEQIPRTGRLEHVALFNREAYALFKRFLERYRGEMRAVDLDLASYVCVTSIEALTHNAVLHQPEILSDETMDTLVEEATRLVLRYLQ